MLHRWLWRGLCFHKAVCFRFKGIKMAIKNVMLIACVGGLTMHFKGRCAGIGMCIKPSLLIQFTTAAAKWTSLMQLQTSCCIQITQKVHTCNQECVWDCVQACVCVCTSRGISIHNHASCGPSRAEIGLVSALIRLRTVKGRVRNWRKEHRL